MKPPPDPADHAADFAERYAGPLDRYAAERMEEFGIPSEQIGSSDHLHGISWCAFNPHERTGGGVSPGGRINVDSGVLNPDRMKHLGRDVSDAWSRARLRDRIDATIAHEFEEARSGTHDDACEHAPETELPIGERTRELLRQIRQGERGLGR